MIRTSSPLQELHEREVLLLKRPHLSIPTKEPEERMTRFRCFILEFACLMSGNLVELHQTIMNLSLAISHRNSNIDLLFPFPIPS
jgi:hypothetical protein